MTFTATIQPQAMMSNNRAPTRTSFIAGNISQIENNESNSAIVQHKNPRTSLPLSQRVSNRELEDIGPVVQNRRRIVSLTLHPRENHGNLHQTFGFKDDSH